MTDKPVVLFLCTHNAGRSLAAKETPVRFTPVSGTSTGTSRIPPNFQPLRCGP